MSGLTTLEAFNTALDIVASLVSFVLFMNFYIQSKLRTNRSDKTLIAVNAIFAVSALADAGTWFFLNNPNSDIFKFCLIVDFELFVCAIATYHLYLVELLKGRVIFPKSFEYIGYPVAIIVGTLWAVSMSFPIFYSISDGAYSHTSWYIFCQIPLFLVFVIDLIIIAIYKKQMKPNEIHVFIMYLLIVMGASFIGVVTDTPAIYVGYAVVLLITYLQIDMKKTETILEQQSHLEEEQALLSLSQIKPHFIYNCLNVIQVLCTTQPDVAENATHRFSCFLRGYIDAMDKVAMVPLEDELYIVENYMYLEKLRFGEKLNLKMDIEEEDFFLPALSIEPLVENAIKYGLLQKPEGGTLSIRTYKTSDEYIVEIADDGVGFDTSADDINVEDEEKKSHVGMKNVASRLTKLCMGYITIDSTINVGTTAKIHIPIKKPVLNPEKVSIKQKIAMFFF